MTKAKVLPLRDDLRGKTIGDRKVIGRAPAEPGRARTRYFVRCKCGEVENVLASQLQAGRQQRCPKCAWAKIRDESLEQYKSELVGHRIGTRVCTDVTHDAKRQTFMVHVRCDCRWMSSLRKVIWLSRETGCPVCMNKERAARGSDVEMKDV